jgi:uncharacterized protein (TIGR03089 family)
VTVLFSAHLQARTARSGSTPLITYYDESRSERTELSALSFSNWVDKTAGLLTDELLVDPGNTVRLDLATTHPAHWVTLVWVAATWRAGCTVITEGAAAVEVVGPDQATESPGTSERVACSLHPLGLGFPNPLPQGVTDYGTEVRAQPDSFAAPRQDPSAPAWIDTTRSLVNAEVAATAADERRILIAPAADEDPWAVIERALVSPVLGGGSSVIVINANDERVSAIAESERAER